MVLKDTYLPAWLYMYKLCWFASCCFSSTFSQVEMSTDTAVCELDIYLAITSEIWIIIPREELKLQPVEKETLKGNELRPKALLRKLCLSGKNNASYLLMNRIYLLGSHVNLELMQLPIGKSNFHLYRSWVLYQKASVLKIYFSIGYLVKWKWHHQITGWRPGTEAGLLSQRNPNSSLTSTLQSLGKICHLSKV